MAGHSKWANIRFRKERQDAKRGKIFTRLIREITVAARNGGGDPNFNPRLRAAIDKAKEHNMPSENIERAIKRGTGELEGVSYEEIRYEGYGPGGAAVLVDCITDNLNRTASYVRHCFEKHGGSLGATGCVAWMFDKKGSLSVDKKEVSEDALMDLALEAGAEDVVRCTWRKIPAALAGGGALALRLAQGGGGGEPRRHDHRRSTARGRARRRPCPPPRSPAAVLRTKGLATPVASTRRIDSCQCVA